MWESTNYTLCNFQITLKKQNEVLKLRIEQAKTVSKKALHRLTCLPIGGKAIEKARAELMEILEGKDETDHEKD